MKKYFIMSGGEQRGPFLLEELPAQGVRPDTYVWCKGMEDWEKAEDNADICRLFRNRVYDLMHPAPAAPSQAQEPEETVQEIPADIISPRQLPEPDAPLEDWHNPPRSMLLPAALATLLCFPPTAFVAVYFSIATRRLWKAAEETDNDQLRKEAHDASRSARMWTGISFFFGMIFWSFLTTRF